MLVRVRYLLLFFLLFPLSQFLQTGNSSSRNWFPLTSCSFQNIYEMSVTIFWLLDLGKLNANLLQCHISKRICLQIWIFFLFRTVVFQNNVLYEDYMLTIHVTVTSTCVTKTQQIFRSCCVTMMLHTILNHLRPKVSFSLTFVFNPLPGKEHTAGCFTVLQHLSRTIPDDLTDRN